MWGAHIPLAPHFVAGRVSGKRHPTRPIDLGGQPRLVHGTHEYACSRSQQGDRCTLST